jgi:hypothetical protein
MEYTREYAQQLKENKKYEESLLVYNYLWDNRIKDWDKWLGWEFAVVLRKHGEIDKAIKVAKETYKKDKSFVYNTNILCWCLYEKYIKNYLNDDGKDFNQFINIANFIVLNTSQNGKLTAYETTIFKVLKVLYKSKNLKYSQIIEWLEKIELEKLSNDTIEYNLNDGKKREGASRKEQYLSLKSKALINTNQFEECIKTCNTAFQSIEKLHYRNELWFELRKEMCICKIGNSEEISLAINRMKNLLSFHSHWAIYLRIYEAYIMNNEIDKSLIYAYKALVLSEPIEKKVNLLQNIGEVLREENCSNYIKYFNLVYMIRKKEQWNISSELLESIDSKCIDEGIKKFNDRYIYVLHKELINEWIVYIKSHCETKEGKISKMLLPKKQSGFIECGKDSYYFSAKNIIYGYRNLRLGTKVYFSLSDKFNQKQGRKEQIAVDLILER